MKKAQVKMMETMAILVIFFFFVVFGFSFYTKIQGISFDKMKRVNLDLNIIKMYQRASFMSELQCSLKDITVDNCYDIYKLKAFETMVKEESGVEEFYMGLFGQSEINIVELYPGDKHFNLYSNPLPVDQTKYREVVSLPISIYNATSRKFLMGLLNITVYSR